VDEIPDTGAGWGLFILWGFALAALLVVFRVLRLRGLPG
jgi:LPXTG-motif cell wall-anchored protein